MIKFLNWINGTREKRVSKPSGQWGRSAIEPLPMGDAPLTKHRIIPTKPLSEKLKEEYRRGRDSVIGGFKK